MTVHGKKSSEVKYNDQGRVALINDDDNADDVEDLHGCTVPVYICYVKLLQSYTLIGIIAHLLCVYCKH